MQGTVEKFFFSFNEDKLNTYMEINRSNTDGTKTTVRDRWISKVLQ